jgi:DNA invertase Pin-like site-specific DNA recombinase
MPTKTKPTRMDGYVRVSRVAGRNGDRFISPDVQRDQIEAWAKLRNVEITAWHEDLDQSGGKLDRPGLEALLARIEDRDTDGVVLAKLDRLSRLGVADALKLVERIEDADGTIAAVDLGLDPTTAFGEFGTTIMLAMARMERRRLSESWDTAKTHALDRGAKVGGTPFGYQREADGTLAVHPERGPLVTETYRLAARDGIDAAREHLLTHAPDKAWRPSRVRSLLGSRSYLGESHHNGTVRRESHPPLTDPATWQAAQHEPDGRRKPSLAFPLTGIAVCGSCGTNLHGTHGGRNNARTYKCGANCDASAYCVAEPLEQLVRGAVRDAWRVGGWTVGGESNANLDALHQAVEDAISELDAFAADQTARRVLGARYHVHLESRAKTVEDAEAAYRAEASKQAQQTRVIPAELLTTNEPAKLRDLFAAALAGVVVTKGRSPIVDRVGLVAHGGDRLIGIATTQNPTSGNIEPR